MMNEDNEVVVEFTITETTNYTGRVTIDTEEYERVMGGPYEPGEITLDDVRSYVDSTGANVEELYGDVQGQEWYDLEVEGAK
jgi:hypothetical protein